MFENPYIDPVTVEHHNTRHLPGGLDPLTGESLFVGQPPLSMEHGGTGFARNTFTLENYALINEFKNFILDTSCKYVPGGGIMGDGPISNKYGGTGFSLDDFDIDADRPDNLPAIRRFADKLLVHAYADVEWYEGCNDDFLPGMRVEIGGTGCVTEGELETMICAKFLSGYDTKCLHAAKHKTGGSDPLTAADIGACADDDSRLTDARTPTAHATSHKTGESDAITPADIDACSDSDSRLSDARVPLSHATTHEMGGTDALTPAGIGASPIGHTHAAYLAASFDDVTKYLTIGTKTFDLSSLVVP